MTITALETNERGNHVTRAFYRCRDRYDLFVCPRSDGWKRYFTDRDSSCFGIWVNDKRLAIVTFVEGDEQVVTCPSAESFAAELRSMRQFYKRNRG